MALQILSAAFNHLYNILYLGVLFLIMTALGMRIFSYFKIPHLRVLEKALFSLTLGVGITGYAIYALGLLHILNAWLVIALLLLAIFVLGKEFRTISRWITQFPKLTNFAWKRIKSNPISLWAGIPLLVLIIFAFIGAAVPETEFDALWYHLTLPKIYILDHAIHFVPGKLLYYSVFPRLTEMMYTLGLLVGNDIVAKLFHFGFGILFLLSIFVLSRRFFNAKVGLLAGLMVYGTFDVLWLSRVAYIDLATAFFGTMTAFALLLWLTQIHEHKTQRNVLILSALSAGLLLATKDWALAVLPAAGFIIFVQDMFVQKTLPLKERFMNLAKHLGIFLGLAFLVVLPWYIDAFINTGNPLYPVGSFHSPEDYGAARNAADWLTRVWPRSLLPFTFQYASSAFTPIFGLLLLLPFVWKKIGTQAKYLTGFGVAYYFVYTFIPTHLYYRYSFGVLGVLAILTAYLFFVLFKNSKWLKAVGVVVIALPLAVNFVMLLKWDAPVFKVFAGIESRDEYLTRTLAPNVFAFYDRDGYFAKNFSDGSKGKILTYNVHNLFYVNFPFEAYENNALDAASIHSAEDFKAELQKHNIHYVLFKNSDIEALWNQLNHPSSLNEFSGIFSKEYQVSQDSITLYKIQ